MSVEQIVALFPALTVKEKNVNTPPGVVENPESLDNSLDYPILNDPNTIQFIKESKVMLINRGLPGSGKSTLTKKIINVYGADKTVVCAGDHFFTDAQGNYNFDHKLLPEAHALAQNKASKACQDGKSPVVIDNTNVKLWEVKRYLEIAVQNNYSVVLIEPRTPWKFDSKSLKAKSIHNVPIDVILEKIQKFEILVPYYFAWFLNEKSSFNLISHAQKALKLCFQNLIQYRSKCAIDPLQVYDFKGGELHCTTKYIGGKKHSCTDDNRAYYEHLTVAQSIGLVTNLHIIGICIAQSTVSAIVSLKDSSQKFLWKNNLTDKDKTAITSDPFYKYRDVQSMFKKLEHGAHAHITLAMAKGMRAKQAVNDLVQLKLRVMFAKQEEVALERKELDEYELIYLNELFCMVKFKNPLIVNSIFTGHY